MQLIQKKKLSITIKFTLIISILLMFITLVAYIVAFATTSQIMRENITQEAISFSKLSARPIMDSYNLYYNSGFLKFKEVTTKTLQLTSSISRIQLININGEIMFDSDNPGFILPTNNKGKVKEDLLDELNSSDTTYIYTSGNSKNLHEIIFPYFDEFNRHSYTIRFFVTYESINKALLQMALAIGILSLVFLLIIFGLVFLSTKKMFLDPINIIEKGIVEIEKGNYGHTINLSTGDDIEKLAVAFNNMSKQVEFSIEQLKNLDLLKNEFISLASHHLRTPLTALRGWVYIIKRDNPDIAKSPAMEAINDSIDKLNSMSEEFISITDIQTPGTNLELKEVSLEQLIQKSFSQYKDYADNKKVTLTLDLDKDFDVLANEKYLQLAIDSIVKNAIGYNNKDGKVICTLTNYHNNSDRNKYVLLTIEDTGAGIPTEKLETLFQKFHRGVNYMASQVEGKGLGLYLVKLIIDLHHGKIWIDSSINKGTKVFILLPEHPLTNTDLSDAKQV